MGELRNEFSWSNTRARVFDECKRKYWFEYYGSWGGWNSSCDERTRTIYVLKKLRGRSMWVGELVHDSVEKALKSLRTGGSPSLPEFSESLIQRMRHEFRLSRQKKYWSNPRDYPGLVEHEYNTPVSDEEWQKLAEHARSCLANFFGSTHYASFQKLPADRWLSIEVLDAFVLDGVKIWVALDCAYRTDQGAVIIDWKTGRAESAGDPVQLPLYALYAAGKWQLRTEDITTIEVNLASGVERTTTASESLVQQVREKIRAGVGAMALYLNSAPRDNVPKTETAFPVTQELDACKRCEFRKVCADSPLNNL